MKKLFCILFGHKKEKIGKLHCGSARIDEEGFLRIYCRRCGKFITK